MPDTRQQYDIAYGCFLFIGVVLLFISILSFIPMGNGVAGGLGFLVMIPLAIASLMAMVVGIGYSARLYHHWPLVFLSLLSILFVAEMVTEYGPVAFYNMVPVLYGASTCAFSLVWFLILRKRWGKDV